MARLCLQVKDYDSPGYAGFVARGDVAKARMCYRRGDVVDIYPAESLLNERDELRSAIDPFCGCVFLVTDDLGELEDIRPMLTLPDSVITPKVKDGIPIVGQEIEQLRQRRRMCIELEELPARTKAQLKRDRWAVVPTLRPFIRDKARERRLSAMTAMDVVQVKRDLDSNTMPREALQL